MAGRVADDADHLRVVGVADHDDVASLLGGALGELLHLGHERARGVDDAVGSLLKLALHLGRDAVRADDRG